MSDPAGTDDPFTLNGADGNSGTNSAETEDISTVQGSAATSVQSSAGTSGELRESPQVGEAELAASQESRRLAEAQDNEA